jgi:flagellar hook-associated protein 1 FlgK
MGLFSSLVISAEALRVFEKALTVTQNNVSNADTAGYARQRATFEAMSLDTDVGLPGGVRSGPVQSARNQYAEQAVRRQTSRNAELEQRQADLEGLEPLYDASGEAGIPGALNQLFQGFLAWSAAPNDAVARNTVIERARDVAAGFVETAQGLAQSTLAADQQIRNSVDAINNLARMLKDLNTQQRQDFRAASDPAVDTQVNNTLEQLAEYVDFTTVKQADGSLTVLLGGQTALVVGDRQYEVSADISSAQAVLRDSENRDVTGQVSGGRLGALLETRNTTIPSYSADLNRLAAGLADRVNAILAAGVDSNGWPGAALFAYNSTDDAAATLSVTSILPEELAAATADAPGGNGNALQLARLADSPEIDGASFMEYYGTLAGQVGRALETTRENQQTQQQLLLQTQAFRQETSGVSLDEEAALLVEFQRSYQASARLVSILSGLTEEIINLVQ